MFQSIYDNYSDYKSIVGSVIGFNTCFVEDIISDCCLNIHTRIKDGRIDINNITIDGKINKVYFKSVLIRKAIDHKRVKRNQAIQTNDFPELAYEPPNIETKCSEKQITLIKEKLRTFENESSSNKFHALVFRHYFFNDTSIYQISKQAKINRETLTSSKKLMQLKVKQWLSEKQK
jgi:hypothetical protein